MACGRLKWPTLDVRPEVYVCVLCQGGISGERREAGRQAAARRKSTRSDHAGGS